MKINSLKLQAKGWSKEEIEHAKKILQKAENTKHPKIILLEKSLYWILLFIVLMGSIIGMWMILPFIIFMNLKGTIIIILFLGLLFGSLASILLKDVENLEIQHHLLISLIIPISAIITSIILSNQVTKLSQTINITTQHNPIILGIVYSVGSLIPFAIMLWHERIQENGTL